MPQVYKGSLLSIMRDSIHYIVWVCVLWLILLGFWVSNLISGGIVLLLLWWILWEAYKGCQTVVTLTHDTLEIDGVQYDLAHTNFGYTIDSTSCNIHIYTTDGEKESIDLGALGEKQFRKLMNDLWVTGDKAPITKLTPQSSKKDL